MTTELGASRLLTVTPEAFLAACRVDIEAGRHAAAQLKAMSAPRNTVEALDRYDTAVERFSNTLAQAELARNVHPSEALRKAAARCQEEVESASTELSLDRGVFDALAGLELSSVDEPTRFYVQRTLRDFRRAGVDRDPDTRNRVKALREELVKLGQQFDDTINADVRTVELDERELAGLPDDYRRAHPAGPNGKVAISTNNTDYVPFVTYATSGAAREALWRAYRLRGHPKNLEVLAKLLDTRQQLATVLGFSTWADYITGDKMIETQKNAADFIARITAASAKRAERDYAELLAHRRRDDPKVTSVDAWDSAHLQEQVKATRYQFDSQSVRPYFEYRRVKDGVMSITSRMFGVGFRAVSDAAVWHPDVEAYDVYEGERLLGRIYLDMYPRENKYKHYAQFTLASGKAGRALPEGVLVCNFPRPGAEPALMEYGDVRTFFHEFGHLLHHVFGGKTRWAGISGVSTEWDFVEAPSQMFEEWVRDATALQTFARHHESNQPIPLELVTRMKAADEFGKGLNVRQQMFYAALSLELHSRNSKGLDTTRLLAELQERYTPFTYVPDTYFQESFTHLNGYSAIYYTYMWSLVIAKDLFTVFERDGLLNPAAAARYRKMILEPGGSKPAAKLVEDFLGRPHQFAAFEAWLNAD